MLFPLILLVTKPLMRDFIGLNTHTVQFKPDLYAPVTRLIRNYHPVAWDLGDDLTKKPTLPAAQNGVHWDLLYGDWKKAGYKTEASAMFESIPAKHWTDIPKQASEYGEQFARAFGPSGLLEAVEIGNEPADFTEAQYRTVFESMAKGIRKGDPKMKIATCAVAVGKEDKYSKDIACLQGLESYIDVLNVHTYAFAEMWPTWRRSFPEDPKINYLKQPQAIVDWRNAHAPGRPIWITEFGYDATTKPNKPTGDFSKWMGNTDAEQAMYIVRSYLTFSAMDIDRAYLYWFNDDDNPQLHGSSGLTRNFKPKPSFYGVAHLLKSLGDTRFEKAILSEPGGTYLYQYRGAQGLVWVVWSATGAGRKAEVTLPAPKGKVVRAERMPLTEGAASSVSTAISRGRLKLTIGEEPVYLWIK
jgi:hypothetical protein